MKLYIEYVYKKHGTQVTTQYRSPTIPVFSKSRKTHRGGGCAFYVHDSLNYDYPSLDTNCEIQLINVHVDNSIYSVINYYNPCKKLEEDDMKLLLHQVKDTTKLLIVGDFNSHNTLWGSVKTDNIGHLIENFLMQNNMVILNDGSGTRMDPHTGKNLALIYPLPPHL